MEAVEGVEVEVVGDITPGVGVAPIVAVVMCMCVFLVGCGGEEEPVEPPAETPSAGTPGPPDGVAGRTGGRPGGRRGGPGGLRGGPAAVDPQ